MPIDHDTQLSLDALAAFVSDNLPLNWSLVISMDQVYNGAFFVNVFINGGDLEEPLAVEDMGPRFASLGLVDQVVAAVNYARKAAGLPKVDLDGKGDRHANA